MAFSFVAKSPNIVAIYVIYVFASTLFVSLPLWFLRYILPSQRPRRSWSVKDAVLIRLLKTAFQIMFSTGWDGPPDADKAFQESFNNDDELGFVWVPGVQPELVKGWVAIAASENSAWPAQVCGYWYGKKDRDGLRDYPSKIDEKVIYSLHCGGYVMGSAHPKHDQMPVVPSLLLACSGLVDRIFAVEYRLASADPFPAANPFPASLFDALAGYRYLVQDLHFKPENIIIEGVAAGGHLATNLVLYLNQARIPSLPAPGAVLLISPTMDWSLTHDGAGSSMVKNKEADIAEEMLRSGYTVRALLGSMPESEFAINPYLSPGSVAVTTSSDKYFVNWPKTCIVAGEAEQTLDAIVAFHKKLLADNEDKEQGWLKFLKYEDMPHAFISYPVAFKDPKKKALEDIRGWLKAISTD